MTTRATANYLACDLGASSGRAVLAAFDGQRVELREVHRFPNGPVRILDHLHWNVASLLEQIKLGIGKAAVDHRLSGIGVDTWGVDYGLLDASGDLVGLPYHYRDGRTSGMMELAFQRVPRQHIYARTGIQFMPLNTLYQLQAEQSAGGGRLERAAMLLFMPDLLNYWLTGARRTDVSIASTSQMLDPRTRTWANDVIEGMGLRPEMFPEVRDCASRIGELRSELVEETGCAGAAVFCPAGHDTACAVAAIPAAGDDWAYVSAGTWSLVGVETRTAPCSKEALDAGVTHELGADGTIRLLRNVTGLWLVQECQRAWNAAGGTAAHTFDELTRLAEAAPEAFCHVDPDDPRFASFGDMPARIREFCRETGQPQPESAGAMVRCALESVALKIGWGLARLQRLTGRAIRVVHVVGGGAANALLCQLIADISSRPVHAGPVEATALGNALLQAWGDGRLATLADLREIVRASTRVHVFEPTAKPCWAEARARFDQLVLA
ncbi:MAG: rhamnulokinase [Phycisphaerales bacterium]|nr:rhamnulokinase [Phycisphaerales bacterium]